MKRTNIIYINKENVLIHMYLHMKIFNTLETKEFCLINRSKCCIHGIGSLLTVFTFSHQHDKFSNKTHSKYSFCHKAPSSWVYLREVVKI